MKRIYFFAVALSALLFAGCTTYQYSARQVNVNRYNFDMSHKMVGVVPNYAKQVSAVSSYQATKRDAIAEAEFLCIQNSKVDVIVDPILKIEYNPWKVKKRYKATIIGFAGMYENVPNRLDESKKYTLEEIEKFKLLYDPSFPQFYYGNGAEGDKYYFNTEKKNGEKKSEWLNHMFSKPKKNKK